MSRKQDGVKPWASQRHLPEDEVTLWQIDTAGAFDEEGNPLPRIRRQVEGSRAKAVAHRRSLLVELAKNAAEDPDQPKAPQRGSQRAKGALTLAEFIEGPYADWFKRTRRASTAIERLQVLQRNVIPLLGKLTLEEANTPRTVSKLKDWLDAHQVYPGRPKKGGTPKGEPTHLKPSSKNQVLLGLSSVLRMAASPDRQPDGKALLDRKIKFDLYQDNKLAPGSTIFKDGGMVMGQSRHKRLSDEQCRELWEACEDDLERVIVGLGLFAGCRVSETCARLWTDVNFAKLRMYIWSALCPETGVIGPTKNSLSGWVPIPKQFVGPLEALKAKAKTEYILEPSVPMSRSTVSWRYWRVAKRAGVERPHNYHALRHTFCSRLADKGVKVQTIQKLARHQNIATTFGYIMPDEADMQGAGDLLDL